jgi:hypothetical protein
MKLAEVSDLAAQFEGVAERRRNGLLEWRYRGRLVARQLDDGHNGRGTCVDYARNR